MYYGRLRHANRPYEFKEYLRIVGRNVLRRM
jgi:hypothetical protein